MTARKRWALVVVTVAVCTGSAAAAPLVLRRMDAFAVRRVAVVGAHYLAPEDAVAASGLTRADNLFDDAAPWIAALERHPLVASARIERQMPGTLVLRITESVPVALVAVPELRAVDERGRVLPIPPGHALDLPVLAGTQRVVKGVLADPAAQAVVRMLVRVRQEEPAMALRISEAHPQQGSVRLVLRNPLHAEALVPLDGGPLATRQLRLTLADLAARGELPLVRRVDARFTDQVVVTLNQ